MHVQLQIRLAFQIKVVLHRPDWLARQLDDAVIGYLKKDTPSWPLATSAALDHLLDAQLQVNWPMALTALVDQIHPVHAEWIPASCSVGYYWSLEQSEWATDVVFRSAAAWRLCVPGWCIMGSRYSAAGRAAVPAAEGPGAGWRARPLRRRGGQRPEASPRGCADQARLRA